MLTAFNQRESARISAPAPPTAETYAAGTSRSRSSTSRSADTEPPRSRIALARRSSARGESDRAAEASAESSEVLEPWSRKKTHRRDRSPAGAEVDRRAAAGATSAPAG